MPTENNYPYTFVISRELDKMHKLGNYNNLFVSLRLHFNDKKLLASTNDGAGYLITDEVYHHIDELERLISKRMEVLTNA